MRTPRRTTLLSALLAALLLCIVAACGIAVAVRGEPPFSPNDYYLDAVGPVRAQEVALTLREENKLPVNGHEYLHEVGEYIYDHYGPDGAKYCRPYFDHACYNGLTIHMTSLEDIATTVAACDKVDLDTFLGCIHGAGHAALFMSNYDVPEALKTCTTLASPYPDTVALHSCAFGVFMENAVPHLIATSGTSSPWITDPWRPDRPNDPKYPCDDPRIGSSYLSGCWRQQGVMIAVRMPPQQSVPLCLSLGDSSYISSCLVGLLDQYGAVGFTKDKADSICSIATGSWHDACLLDAVDRAFMNGYTPSLGPSICASITDASSSDCAALVARDAARYR